MNDRPITFDDFEPGRQMGATEVTYSDELAGRWQRIFGAQPADGAGGAAEGASLAVVMMMRAYMSLVAPRPPGNVHARQQLTMDAPPRPGETIRTAITCTGKELRRERRYVDLEARATGDGGRALFTGRLTLIWAA